jgi:hypothetical protein
VNVAGEYYKRDDERRCCVPLPKGAPKQWAQTLPAHVAEHSLYKNLASGAIRTPYPRPHLTRCWVCSGRVEVPPRGHPHQLSVKTDSSILHLGVSHMSRRRDAEVPRLARGPRPRILPAPTGRAVRFPLRPAARRGRARGKARTVRTTVGCPRCGTSCGSSWRWCWSTTGTPGPVM